MYIEISYAYRERALPLVLYDTPEWSPVSLSCLFIYHACSIEGYPLVFLPWSVLDAYFQKKGSG